MDLGKYVGYARALWGMTRQAVMAVERAAGMQPRVAQVCFYPEKIACTRSW